MQSFPHIYHVNTSTKSIGNVDINSEGLATIQSAPPAEFGGDGKHWSPETLLVAAVADCFCLSFKTIAQGFKLPWQSLNCKAEGSCLITNSLRAESHLTFEISIAS